MRRLFTIALVVFVLLGSTDAIMRWPPSDAQVAESIKHPRSTLRLPRHVVAPSGQLSLFADYNDRRGEKIVLYLVNRTDSPVTLAAQGHDVYVKLEGLVKGRWQRAQTHFYSWCGNSYFFKPTIGPSEWIAFFGHAPRTGVEADVRYARIASEHSLVSNVGRGYVLLSEIEEASRDGMAIKFGELEFVSKVATGEVRVSSMLRDRAIMTLGNGRFPLSEVEPILRKIAQSDDFMVSESAKTALQLARSRRQN